MERLLHFPLIIMIKTHITRLLVLSIFSCFTYSTQAQEIDIAYDYQVIRASGEVPSLLTNSFEDVIASEIDPSIITKEKDQQEYAQFVKLALMNMFKSGDVLFGDPLTQYVEKVGQKILKNTPNIANKISFFVLKSNYTNALMMEPGVVFVTTGMLAQIENEAQLAFVLAHEVSHYNEKHLQKSYANRKDEILDDDFSFLKLSQISKEHEIEADVNAIKMYHDAGYSKDEIDITFLVLMYSYLPFDEVKVDPSFFKNENIYIPTSYFPESSNPIKAFEDYTDILNTHPNIKTRKAEVAKAANEFKNWQNNKNFLPKEDFERVRDLARFETVRMRLLNGTYVKGLYETFILNEKYPENEYLAELKASFWLEINKIYLAGGKRSFLKNTNRIEGSISSLYYFFNQIDKEEMGLLSMRMIEDVYKLFPESKNIQGIRDLAIKTLAYNRSLDVKTLEKISFYDALALGEKEKLEQNGIEVDVEEVKSKYDKISQIQQQNSSSQSVRPLTDEHFAYYLLDDLVNNEDFITVYEAKQKEYIEERIENKSKEEKKIDKREQEVYVLALTHFSATKKGSLAPLEAFKFEETFNNLIEKRLSRVQFEDFQYRLFTDFTVEEYNVLPVLYDYILFQRNSTGYIGGCYPEQEEAQKLFDRFSGSTVVFFYADFVAEGRQMKGTMLVLDTLTNEVENYNYKIKASIGVNGVNNLLLRLFQNIKK